jgi:hypothetical protein
MDDSRARTGAPGQDPFARDTDSIQQFFGRPFFLSLTIGFPFCLYKIIFGISAVRAGVITASYPLELFGWVVVIWAAIDLVMNLGRAASDLLHRPARFEYCLIAQAGRMFRRPMAFLALDTLVSFTIICLMLWSGWIARLTPAESYLWYFSTTLNLISLSLVSLYNEVRMAR